MDDGKFLSINLPLIGSGKSYGMLVLKKDLLRDWNSHYTLRRVEHLRRSIVRKLQEFEGNIQKDLIKFDTRDRPGNVQKVSRRASHGTLQHPSKSPPLG